MKTIFFLLLAIGFLFSGCGLLPYKTESTCKNVIGGVCGSALDNHKSSMREIEKEEEGKIDFRQYKGVE